MERADVRPARDSCNVLAFFACESPRASQGVEIRHFRRPHNLLNEGLLVLVRRGRLVSELVAQHWADHPVWIDEVNHFVDLYPGRVFIVNVILTYPLFNKLFFR